MLYCSREQLEERYPATNLVQLCDDEMLGAGNAAIAGRIDAALLDASVEVDMYLAGRGSVPSPTPSFVQQIVADSAMFNLYKRRSSEPPKTVIEARRQAQKSLLLLQAGTLKFAADEVGSLSPIVSRDEDDRVFPDSMLRQFQ